MFSWALREEYKMQRSKIVLERKLNDLIIAETIETDFFRGEYVKKVITSMRSAKNSLFPI